ncbi:hypothetical protein [Vibrio anguillarum]|uniref:hypothetical protein n=1 Tax=Vibrio anguillarum TaxID=55601 RepID=UPI001BE4CF4A|nr:hypothetical protein [Vibrio anguillarum]
MEVGFYLWPEITRIIKSLGCWDVGIEVFYFNPSDFTENRVHEGFIGFLLEYQGQGIVSIMQQQAFYHFKIVFWLEYLQ